MAIANFPAALQPIIQTGYLERRFQQALRSVRRYRLVAEQEPFAVRIGESLTKTRAGLLGAVTQPMTAAQATNPTGASMLDNGLTPDTYAMEQYQITIARYAKTMNLDLVGDQVGLANQFVQNAVALGENAARSLDDIARNALFSAYLGGNTRVRVTLGAAGPTISVDDIRGFQTTAVNGVQQTVSATYPMNVTVGSNVYSLTSATPDGTNVTTAPGGGISGTLTFGSSVTVADGTAGNAVVAATAPSIIRPAGRATSAALQASDVLTMANLLDAKAKLELNAVPKIDGFYHLYLDPVSSRQLFADSDFKLLFQGATAEQAEYRAGEITNSFLGLRFLPTTEALVQAHPSIAGAVIRRPIICGQGALIEGNFAGNMVAPSALAETMMVDGIAMVTREPLDRLQQEIAQSWIWIGGFCAPTDLTTTPSSVSTATNAAFKRSVVLEHIG
ncbi:MAG: hypothetical protein NVS3B5_18930 [Sphingomicrobium sp.]